MREVQSYLIHFCLQVFSKEYINLLLTGYFFFLGILALTHLMSPVVSKLIPTSVPNIPFHLLFVKGKGPSAEDILNYEFTSHDLVTMGLCTGIGIWYLLKKVFYLFFKILLLLITFISAALDSQQSPRSCICC
jgi:hypothetical protein